MPMKRWDYNDLGSFKMVSSQKKYDPKKILRPRKSKRTAKPKSKPDFQSLELKPKGGSKVIINYINSPKHTHGWHEDWSDNELDNKHYNDWWESTLPYKVPKPPKEYPKPKPKIMPKPKVVKPAEPEKPLELGGSRKIELED